MRRIAKTVLWPLATMLSVNVQGGVKLRSPFGNLEVYEKNEVEVIERTSNLLNKSVEEAGRKSEKAGTSTLRRRGAHPKGHGLVEAELEIFPEKVPIMLKDNPLFNGKHPALVRFSNGTTDEDFKGDLRGIAIKVLGVEGDKYFDRNSKAVDLLAINTPLPVGTAKEFLTLVEGAGAIAKWAFWNFNRARKTFGVLGKINSEGKNITSLLFETYESQIYFAGSKQSVFRFKFEPQGGPFLPREKDLVLSPDFLKADLAHRLQQKAYKFDFKIAYYDVRDRTSKQIEDAFEEAPAASEYRTVGTLTFNPQHMTEAKNRVAEYMSYNVWRSTLRPLGSIGRAREFVYEGGVKFRRAQNGIKEVKVEPDTLEGYLELFGE